MSNADQVADSQSPISVAEFARRQLAVVERQMLSATDLADLVELSIMGIRQLSGGSQVELWLHDPVGELDRHLDAIGVLSGAVRLLDDSYSFVSLYSEDPCGTERPLACSTIRRSSSRLVRSNRH